MASDGAASGSASHQARQLLETIPDQSAARLQDLENQRKSLKAERKRLNSAIKLEARQRKRVLKKAKGLSVDELFHAVVLTSRPSWLSSPELDRAITAFAVLLRLMTSEPEQRILDFGFQGQAIPG